VTLIFHFIMLIVDGGILAIYHKSPRFRIWVAAAGGGTVVAGLAAVSCMQDAFDLSRYAALAIFLHAPLVLLGTAIIARRKNRRWAALTLAAALAIACIAVDAFWIEPHWLEVNYYTITSAKLHRPLRIVVIADPQMDDFGEYERSAFERALAEKADLILLAGDYLQSPSSKHRQLLEAAREYLAKQPIAAPLGAYAVEGNVDPGDWRDLFKSTGITPIAFRRTFLLQPISLTCLSLGESYVGVSVPNPNLQKFHIVLGHVPNFARGAVDADLLIAGHTHGGQVRLPGIGPVVANAQVPRSWAAGMTDLPRGGKLFVCRGIGMERGYAPRLRFLCRPEVAVIDLLPEKQE
jgi:uncharacterized protein